MQQPEHRGPQLDCPAMIMLGGSLADILMQVSVISATLFTAFSIGTALAPSLASFFIFRILTAFQGTAFLVVGSAVIGDIYKPVRRRIDSLHVFTLPATCSPTLARYVLKMLRPAPDYYKLLRPL